MMGVLERLELPPMGSHELGTEKTPVDHYISPEFFELEKRHIFAKSWLMVGRESDVRNPGDYVLHQVEPLSASVIIVRGKDAVLRAFHNTCTHRGSRIVNAPCGKARGGLVCPFHGWAYGFDGKLLNVPAQETFGSLNLDDEKLRPVSVDVWGGFVFINLDPSPVHSLHEYFAQLGDVLERYLANPKWSWSYGWRSSFKANWKFHVDAQVEGYHVDQNHRNTIFGNIPSDSCRPYAFPDSVGVPGGVSAYLGPDPTAGLNTPVATLSARFGATSPFTKAEKRFEADGFEGVVRTEHPLWVFDNYLLFPNVVMFVQKGQLYIQRTTPISADECIWEVDFYHTNKITNFGEMFNSEQGRIQLRDVLSEDLSTAEGIHANFKSGAITEINMSAQEVVLRAFTKAVMRATGQKAEAEAAA